MQAECRADVRTEGWSSQNAPMIGACRSAVPGISRSIVPSCSDTFAFDPQHEVEAAFIRGCVLNHLAQVVPIVMMILSAGGYKIYMTGCVGHVVDGVDILAPGRFPRIDIVEPTTTPAERGQQIQKLVARYVDVVVVTLRRTQLVAKVDVDEVHL